MTYIGRKEEEEDYSGCKQLFSEFQLVYQYSIFYFICFECLPRPHRLVHLSGDLKRSQQGTDLLNLMVGNINGMSFMQRAT